MGLRWLPAFALAITFLLVLPSMPTATQAATKIVGGSEHWHFGFNYTAWALTESPFYINDTLVFNYDPPNSTTFPHSVYLLKNRKNFKDCNLQDAKLVANVTQGGGSGFEFVLKKKWKPYYFACGERNGIHCNDGLMKFSVFPLHHPCQD